MQLRWRTEAPQLAIIVAMFLASAIAWPLAPERIPIYWNIAGEVDGYGGKVEGLLLTPAIALGLYVLLAFLPRVDPARQNYGGAYTAIRLALMAFLGAMHIALLFVALGYPVDISRVILALMGSLFVVLGATMGRLQPNWFAGIRTPWTLGSRVAWTKTHRVGGWVFGVAGALFLVGAVLGSVWLGVAGGAAVILGAIGLVVYSYFAWRNDPVKEPAISAH
jgi:uncharacterized membrane protein